MSLFRRLFAESEVSRLEERVEKLEGELKTLRLDWEDIYERCRRLLARSVKERGRIEAARPAQEEPVAVESDGNTHGGLLTDRQKQIQQQILRKRARMTGD